MEVVKIFKRTLPWNDLAFPFLMRLGITGAQWFDLVTREKNGDEESAWKYLQNNQGLYIMDAFKSAGFGEIPVILAYDFSYERRRQENLIRIYPSMHWVSDIATPDEIRALFDRCCRKKTN